MDIQTSRQTVGLMNVVVKEEQEEEQEDERGIPRGLGSSEMEIFEFS